MNASDFFTSDYVSLLKLIQKGDKAKAQAVIGQGLSLDVHGKDGITPLFWLILKNDMPAIDLALQLGANPNFAESKYGDTPLNSILGGSTKDDALVKLLLKNGANPNIPNRNGSPALFAAIGGDSRTQIDLLLAHGADINLQDKLHRNAALYTTYLNKFDLTYYLIERGGDYTNRATTGADIAWSIHDKLTSNLLSPEFPAYGWALKLKALLESKGIVFPPPSPAEVRAQWAKDKSQPK